MRPPLSLRVHEDKRAYQGSPTYSNMRFQDERPSQFLLDARTVSRAAYLPYSFSLSLFFFHSFFHISLIICHVQNISLVAARSYIIAEKEKNILYIYMFELNTPSLLRFVHGSRSTVSNIRLIVFNIKVSEYRISRALSAKDHEIQLGTTSSAPHRFN